MRHRDEDRGERKAAGNPKEREGNLEAERRDKA